MKFDPEIKGFCSFNIYLYSTVLQIGDTKVPVLYDNLNALLAMMKWVFAMARGWQCVPAFLVYKEHAERNSFQDIFFNTSTGS